MTPRITESGNAACRRTAPAAYTPLRGVLSLVLFLVGAGASPALAQEFGIPPTVFRKAPLPDHAQLVLNELNRPAVVTLLDGSTLRGIIGDATATELVLLMDRQTLMGARLGVSWAQISSVRIERRSTILQGLLLGGAGGALFGYATPVDNDPEAKRLGLRAPQRVWDSALQGALLGAALGAIHGLDLLLPYQPESFGVGTIRAAGQRPLRPNYRVISTAPLTSVTVREITDSLRESPFPGSQSIVTEASWNGHPGATLALETAWPWDADWWLLSRLEWSSLPRMTAGAGTFGDGLPGSGSRIVWREYRAIRSVIGLVRPFGSVSRLPFFELAFLGGFSYTTLSSGGAYRGTAPPEPFNIARKQTIYRPIVMVTGSLALIRRPTLGVALRIEGVIGPGFTANALTHNGELLIPRRRITPIGLSLGLEVYFPRF